MCWWSRACGTGKTRTLVERCLHCLLEETPPVSIEELLVVTFTEAAATEMREKIREALNRKVREIEHPHDSTRPGPLPKDQRSAAWLTEQLALFESAHIGTLHSFCLKLLRQHFYELELDPQLTVMAEEEARLLADETMDGILEGNYAGKADSAEAVQQLIQTHGRGWDQPVRALVLRLHDYTQTLRDPEAWFTSQLAMFQSPAPAQWRIWLEKGLREWRDQWLVSLEAEGGENKIAAQCAALLREELPDPFVREQAATGLAGVRLAEQDCPRGKKSLWCKPLGRFFDEARFLELVTEVKAGKDPLAEDWEWVRGQMTALLNLARDFTFRFGEAKREQGVVDFHDLEQHALRALWDRATGQPHARNCLANGATGSGLFSWMNTRTSTMHRMRFSKRAEPRRPCSQPLSCGRRQTEYLWIPAGRPAHLPGLHGKVARRAGRRDSVGGQFSKPGSHPCVCQFGLWRLDATGNRRGAVRRCGTAAFWRRGKSCPAEFEL